MKKVNESGHSLLIVLGIIIILGIGVGFLVWKNQVENMAYLKSSNIPANNLVVSPQPISSVTDVGQVNKTGTSDGQLDKDLSAINNNLNKLDQNMVTSNQDVSNESKDTPTE